MSALLVSEYRKFVSTRMWWVLLLIMAAYMAVTAAALGFAVGAPNGGSGPVLDPTHAPELVYTTAASVGYAFPALIGVLAVAGEFRHGTITPTFLATPQRGRVLVAKMLAAIPMGLAYGAAGTAASTLAGALTLHAQSVDPLLGAGHTWQIIVRSVLAMALWLVVGVALGSFLTNQVAAIVTLLVFTQFVEPLARMALGQTSWGSSVGQYLPGAAGDAVAGGSMYSALGSGALLPLWAGFLVLLGYAVIFALIGRFTTLRKDIS